LHSLRGVLSFMLLNLGNPILLAHQSHSIRKVGDLSDICSHTGALEIYINRDG
jgi:hypothetical protein